MSTQWKVEWERIAARIESIVKAGRIVEAGNTYKGVPAFLSSQLSDVVKLLGDFFERHRSALPADAKKRFDEVVKAHGFVTAAETLDHVRSRLALVIALQAELQWLLSDPGLHLMSIAERAFLHLSRLLVVDLNAKNAWQAAFNATKTAETTCEQLGAAHLLLHGIYAFKADTTGARTDLVLGNHLVWTESLGRAVEGLVLTEWKIVRDAKDSSTTAKEAREQAELYKRGALAGVELETVRYVVLVSEKDLPRMDDLAIGGTTYRHMNIAVNPDVPSKQSKKTS